MKKFAKILGFLGFFVTIATAQIGTAWAGKIKCEPGTYLAAGKSECEACLGVTDLNNLTQGVYCPGGDFDVADYDQGIYGCYGYCGNASYWLDTQVRAEEPSQCIGTCQIQCLVPDDCTSQNNCYPLWDSTPGQATCGSTLGSGVCNAVAEECKTVTCQPCYMYDYNVGECVPKTNKTPQYRCSLDGGSVYLGSDATYGQQYTVTGSANLCTPPSNQEFTGWILTNDNNSGPYMPGATIASWPCVNDPVIFVASFFGCPADQYLNEETGECKPCDTEHDFHSQPGSTSQHACQKSCVGECWRYDNPQQYHSCGTGETGQYISSTIPGTQYEDWGNGCYYADNQNALIPDTDVAAQECHWECGCNEPCYEEVNGSCVPSKWTAYYDCNDGSSVYADPNQPESYGVYLIADHACVSEGQTFLGWTPDSGGHVYNYNDPINNRLTWSQCADQTFKPVFEDTCYEVSFNDGANGGRPNDQNGTHGPFYKKYNDTQYNWYTDSKCTEKVNGGNPSVANNLPWKENATFTGYYYETPTPDRQIFNANGNLTTGSNSGSDWTIDGNTVLYAQYTCDENYELDANGDCVGDKIDVKYTCVSPVDGGEPEQRTFNNDATYGAAYLVKSVGTGNHNVRCAFTGYELDDDYVWNLQDYSGNSTNPNGEYGPNETLSSADWQYITTTPLTEIEFILDKSLWHLKTYNVEYRCGTIKPDADVYTDSSATYGQTYNVAGQFDPFNGGNVTVQDFLDNNCKPNGGFGAWTFQNWTFTCAGANSGPYNTNDPTFGTWTYDSNNCYFTANWAQTDFVIILDSNIDQDPMNNGSDVSDPEELYTRLNYKVYSCPERTNSCEMGSLTAIPTKVVTVTLNGNDGQFTWNNETVSEATDDSKFTFLGFYESEESNSDQYIYGEDDANSGLITNRGKEVGIGYDGTNAPYTWYAHWENRDAVILPEPIERPGFTFNGWLCVHEEVVPGVDPTQYNGGDPILNGSFVPEDNATCTALWTEACYEIEFNDNGGTPSSNGTHQPYYKKHNDNKWYTNATCASVDYDPTVANNMPSKEHATFTGYYDETQNPDLKIFAGTNDTPQGGLTSDGASWTVTDNATLYAQYECDEPYHLDTNPNSETVGQCVACAPGTFYDPNELNPANQCKNCNQYIHDYGDSGAGTYTWTSRSPYNWSIEQCYRTCGSGVGIQETCTEVATVPGRNEMEQFLGNCEGCTPTGKQISFYGNEFATDPNNRVNTCDAATGAINCPQGFLSSGAANANKLMAAAVDFYQDRDVDGTYELSGTRYIIGGRTLDNGVYKLNNGFVWSQVVGDAQLEGNTEGRPGIISIIYPATLAPTVADPEHYTFTGYGYPADNPDISPIDSSRALTTGTSGNAAGIISYAINLDPANNNMSPVITQNRNLYAQYTANPTYTLTYSCGDGGGTPSISPNPVTGIYAGARIVPAQPEGCTNYGNLQFRWWAVSNSTDTHLAGDAGEFEWAYTENKTFTAIWGAANTYNITYLKMPTTNNSITPAGNTLEMPSNQSTSMPDSYTCNASPDTSISGVPRLKNANNEYIGEVVMWCTDSETCDLPLELSNAAPCADKNVYAKWECTDPRYHLNETRDDCVVCNAGEYWNATTQNCESCSAATGGDFPYSTPGFNWSIDQCYNYCASNLTCTDTSFSGIYTGGYANCQFTKINDTNRQIEFYGNHRTGVTACDGTVEYCAYGFAGCGTPDALIKPVTVQVDFKKTTNDTVGQRYIFGSRSGSGSNIDVDLSTAKIWSQIVGQGQQEQVSGGNYSYTHIIYPTYTAPAANQTGQDFTGYYYPESNGTRYVEYDLGLDATNAQSVLQSQPGSISAPRSLFAKYCSNGQEWNGSACIGTDYEVKYVCNGGVVETDRATYDQTYTVLNHDSLTGCTAPDGKVFVGWGFSNNGITPYLAEYEDGEEFTWQYTVQQPTFTAIWDDGCYAVLINNTEFGGVDPVGYSTPYVQFHKKGLNWYTSWDNTCSENTIPNLTISALPTIGNGSFAGYDIDNSSQNLSTSSAIFQFNNVTNNAVVSYYGQNNWTITDNTTLYAKYTCDSNYTMQLVDGGYVCIQNGPTPEQYHTITLNKNVGTLHGEDSDPTVLYTIEGNTTVYENAERTEPFSRLDENPKKYAYVTFHFCDGGNNSCEQPSTENVTQNAYFTFGGFYELHPDVSDRYISVDGLITQLGGTVAAGLANDTTWYAVWNDYGTVASSDWQSNPTPPSGYAFTGWYTASNCGGTVVTVGQHFTTDTDLYACWKQLQSCEVACTWPGAPTGPVTTTCPTNMNYPSTVVNCTYDPNSPSAQQGYYAQGTTTPCLDPNTGLAIVQETCDHRPNCQTGYVWNSDPDVWACVPNTGITYNVQFKCNETDVAAISGYNFDVTYGQSITIPSNSDCQKPGHSYSQWKATQYNNPATLPAQGTTYQYPWEQTHGETFIADWNDGNVYHVTLAQTDATTDATVQDLYEKYASGWGYTETGPWNDGITLRDDQLPRRTGYTFGGYKDEYGQQQGSFTNNTWTTPDATTVTRDQTWTPIWTRCSDPYFYYDETSGQCKECESAFHDNPVPGTHEGCYSNCSESCRQNTSVCSIPNALTYTLATNVSYPGKRFYPGNAGCQLDIWATEPELNGMIPNCECRVQTCETGYHPNNNNTACLPNTYMITLNSHSDSFYGDDSVPTALYTKFGTNGGIWLDQYYTRPMVVGTMLDNNPTKYATVILNGNGGSFQWNGYTVTQTNAQADFEFNGFYNSVNSGIQYISGTDGLQTAGLTAAQQIPDNQTWHAQWTNGSITLPNATRDGYTFNGWWTLPGGGTFAGNAGSTYTPVTTNPTLYAQWVNGVYYINYHDDEGSLFFNASTSHCTPTTYTYGTQLTISCQLTPTANSHAVFKGWCKTPGANCAATQTITSTDYGNKDYYAWWGCESGYNANNGICEPDTSALCPARTLPNNAHATFVSGALNSNGTECIYTLKCEACTGCNPSLYTCYTNGNSANNNGIFTVIGNIGDANVLADTHCNPTEYDVYYRCDGNSQGYAAQTKAVYGQAYSVEYNPHNNANGVQLDCQSNNQLFNGWAFNGEPNQQFPYSGGTQISPWVYCNITPIFTAQYGQCPTDQVYVPSLGECKYTCVVNCTWPGYPANPAACPTIGYPSGAMCYYNSNSNQLFGYKPSQYGNQCLDIDTGLEITTPRTCDVDSSYDPICPDHYTWNASTRTCDPDIYYVTLNSNNGTEDPNFVSKLFEQYNVGWSTTENDFVNELILGADELPSSSNECEQFDGYYNRASGGQRMVQPSGFVGQNAVQPLPATTITNNNQTWYAHYVATSASFTIRFRCSANGGDIYSYTVQMGDTNLSAPAATVCSGVAFNQWKGSTHPEILLDAGSYFAWNHCFDEVFIPDTKAVYHVDLNANGGTFPSDDYQQLWYAVDMGWYKDERLAPADRITYIPGDQLPIKTNSNFNGWLDNATQQPRGNFSGTNWNLPNSISANETWNAQWGPCNPNEYWDGGVCKNCSDQTSGAFPYAVPGATSIGQCYNTCDEQCKWNSSIAASCNIPNAISYEPDEISYPGKRYFNNQLVCSLDIWAPNPQGTIPNCGCIPTACEPGYILNGQSCVEDKKHIITLDSHIIHGWSSEPDMLYTWHNRGVYLYSNYTGEMTLNQNPLNENPLNYAIVTFNLNGQGASLVWNGQTYTGTMNANVLFDYQGFWKSVNGSPRYIDVDGHINGNGRSVGMAATDDLTWHARWQPRALGTVSQSGNDLPQPTRPGYTFDGWYDLPVGGNQVYSSSLVNNDMTVYARWSDEIYTVNLVSDRNNCQQSNNTPTKLFEKYNVGWNRYTTGTFDPNLTLTDDELPTPNAGYIFDGYYDAPSGGQRVIRSDGRVIQEPNYTDNTHTWYARCVRPNGPFTVTFKCDTDGHVVQSGSVNYGANVTAPTVADANCTKPGHTFTKWKAVVNNENVVFNAGETDSWGYYSGADFVPNWTTNNYNVKYVCNGVTVATDGATYGATYTALNHNSLSGCTVPAGKEFGGWGFSNNGATPYLDVYSDGDEFIWLHTVSQPTFTAIWSECGIGEYWDGYKCYPCPDGFTDNPHAIGIEQCYGNCQYDCQESGCPSPSPVGMQSCAPNHSGYPQWGIKYNRPGATCLPQGQQSLPICPNDIICNNGYDLVGTECRDNRYTITLDSDLYNDNGTPANPSTLYTWFNHGVYRDFARTLEMTPNENPLAVGTPSTFATVTLNGNGAYFNWHNQYGPQLQDNIDFVFDGFYDTTGAAIDPVIGIDRHITEAGQSIGTTAQNNQTWRASWRNGSVDLPSISRDGYTFDGWWTECNGGTRVSMGDQTIAVSGDRTLCAHWSGKSYTVTYNCNSEDGQGGSATDNQLAYQNTSYIVRENFIPCSKPATETTRAHEFENWKFNLNSTSYWPGDPILWTFIVDNPTFNAHYKECPDGWYFDGSCKTCPNDYNRSDIDATIPQNCYKDCSEQCIESCPQLGEPGVIGCIYPTPRPTTEGQEYYGSTCNAVAENCEVIGVYCMNGYVPTSDGLHCQEDEDNYHEITLDPNGGTVGQEKLYTIHNIGVYLDSARTRQMSAHNNYLTNLPWKNAVATFDCNPECSTPVSPVSVELVFNGYYERQSGGAKYINKFVDDGVAKGAITSDGNTAGKGYTDNATWFAQWSGATIGNSRWPENPVRPDACVTYSFDGWWTTANGGTPVSYNTPVSENVTWYAHWCESCPASIENGSCSATYCKATITCDTGYYWNADNCSCVLSPDTRFTLTYKPNGGTPTQPRTQSLAYGETFTTLGGDTFTKSGEVLCRWDEENHASSNTFPEAVAELSTEYTYRNEENITLLAHWAPCQCIQGAAGVQGCSFSVVNNACVPTVTCMPGYIPNGTPTCAGECNATCDTSNSCRQCPAGTYQDGNECIQCPEGFTSDDGATSCYGNTISIDWDENGGNAIIPDGSCVYGQTFTLANAPSHSNSAMQFLGWKLANDEIKSAGASVMCNFTNVGVYSGTSTAIQAQWNECQCNYPLNPHVAWCQAWFADGECKYMNGCDAGYEPDPLTVYTPAAVCNPKNYNITYNCGDGIGIPEYLTDSATFNENYTVKGRGTCQMTGFNFAGWKLSANNQTYQPGYRFEPWNFTQQNPTFTAQYSQCAAGEIWTEDGCEPCTCSQENWGTGVASCTASPSSISTCSAVVTCETGYNNPQGTCDGATCSAQCNHIQSNAIYVCGDGATGNPPATETMNYGATHTVKDKASCVKSGYTFNGWNFTGTNGNYNPGATVPWYYEMNQTFTGQWCENCGNVANGSCSLNATFAGQCSYTCGCEPGYRLVGECNAYPVCKPDDSLTITYRPNGGMNNGVLGQPVIQNVIYGFGFITKPGTIFTKENSIITAWDHVEGGDYPELNHWYEYNTDIDTILDAHWEQCTCNAPNCTTYATDSNTCACSATCPTGYTYGGCNCNGTVCEPVCNQCAETEISIDNECVECECTPGAGASTCGALSTVGNVCEWNPSCLDRFINVNPGCSGTGNTICNPTCTECPAGYISNADHTECVICPANTYQSGNTCVPCQNGYTSPAGSSSADACVPGAHTIHYLSNNGANETYNQGVYYGQSFVTEGGTRFTKVNNIMTQWKVENDATTTTFPTGIAGLSGDYVYGDTTDTTLEAQWSECGCDADNCTTYATNSNECACNASEESCPDGYIYGGCECNGTNCAPICTLSQSNAIYNCGTGTGIPPVSELVSYGTPYTIKANATVYGCSRENSTFAGWEFDGDQQIHAAGDTVTWNFTTDKNFRAVYCNNCLPEDHCTLDIPNPGECVVTCHTGYEWDSNLKKCVAKTYPGDEGITYKPNGGTPNRNYTQSVTYDAPFTTLDWSVEHYTKAHHILTRWDVESGGAGTFNSGYAALGTEYTYHTDGATVLAADWTECATDEISLNNTCRQCGCTNGTGAASCGTLSTDDDTCTWGPVSCQTGYVTPVLGCSDDTTNCTASCTACGTTQVEVDGTCENCVCDIVGDANGIISGCGFASNNGNTCNWDPTTCRLGYGYPELTCTETEHNNNCTASCTICPAGTYGDNGVECKPCPEGKTSLAGATSIRECFIDPNSCAPDEHIEHGECVSNTRACSIPNATSAARIWNPAIGTYGPCTVVECDTANGYHESGNACVRDTCVVAHGSAESEYSGGQWECFVTKCDPGYEPSSDYKSCVECANRYVDGDVAVSGYISECEIAACMYQGQKYALQNGECVPICENASDETGTKVWDERTKKCIRTCNPGYKMW